jgi:threonine synthase
VTPKGPGTRIVSGASRHADRIATIRDVERRYGLVVDPHTADGLHVGAIFRDRRVPLVAIETALPAKFSATISEALGRPAPRPAAFEGLEALPQHVTRLPANIEQVRDYIAAHAIRA